MPIIIEAFCFLRPLNGNAAITPIVTTRSRMVGGDSAAIGEVGGRGFMPVSDSSLTRGVEKVMLALLLAESVAVKVCVPL